MQTYLEQITALAKRRGIPLRRAVLHAGVADSQFYRWRLGRTRMSETTAIKVRDAIEDLAGARRRSVQPAH